MARIFPIFAALMAGVAAPAAAESDTIVVTMTVLPSCRVAAGQLDFGSVGAQELQRSAQAPVTLECTPGTPYTVAIDEGRQGGRRMADAGGRGFVPYEIYQDAAGARRWGAGDSAAVAGTAPPSGRVELVVHGRVSLASAAAGQYSDEVTVSVAF